ncbi:MAG: flagellar export protein FliJ [Limnobacter sp.]|nr:flagellar export protein FliJ [Limnobacter sp.]
MTMHAIEILLDQAKERVDEATQTLAKTRQQLKAARDKLDMLEQYMGETCQNQSLRATGAGLTGFQLKNQNAFNSKMREAVNQQSRQVDFFVKTEEHHVKLWQEALVQQKKFEAVMEREKRRQQAKENKRDQKMNDEFAARIHRVRTNGETA